MQRGKRILILICVAATIFVAGLLGLAALTAFLYYEKIDISQSPIVAFVMRQAAPSSSADNPQSALTDRGNYKTENNWIAAKNAEEIAGFAWLIVHPDQPLPPLKVTATVDTIKQHVHLELKGWSDQTVTADLDPAFAWDSRAYAAFAHQLLGDRKTSEPTEPAASDFLTDLLTPTGEILARKDLEISKALSQNPASASLHEKAALLLLTVALRENAGILSDIRVPLNRACAHLAIARALEGGDPTSSTGKVAQAALLTLSGREIDAIPALDSIHTAVTTTDAAQTWVQILTLFIKDDFRVATPDKSSPLLLKIVWAGVVSDDFEGTLAMSYIDRLGDLEDIPDWGRALFSASTQPAVELGHRFCGSTLKQEFRELQSILSVAGQKTSPGEPLRNIFNEPVGPTLTVDGNGKTTVEVVGLPLFKDIAERHIISDAWQMHYWLKNMWGVPEEDAKFIQQMGSLFQGARHEQYLTLFLNSPNCDTFPSRGSLQDDMDDIPPSFGMHIGWSESDCDTLIPYFGWGVPFGAPLNMKIRSTVVLNARTSHHRPDKNAPTFRDLMPLDPDSYDLASWVIILNQNQNVATTEKEEYSLLHRFFDHNTNSAGYFLSLADNQSDFDEATIEEVKRAQTELDPDEFYSLGDILMSHGQTDEAMEAYRKGATQGNDQVLFSDAVGPLVRYDFNHGQVDEATTLAKRAADVYSRDGLATYAWLLCKLNRGSEAEDIMKQIQERYGGDPLPGFYALHRDLFPDQYAAEEKAVFPHGLQPATLASFTASPSDGALITTASPALDKGGLRKGDVIVALDGYATHDDKQYTLVRQFSDAPVLDLIVWRDGKYFETKASPPDRLFGVGFIKYQP
jgi:hypothetical protein